MRAHRNGYAVPGTSPWTKFYYGFGSVAYGVKDNGFSFFLLLYYNQVLGLPADWVGPGIMVALIVDAISDPIVGRLSDNLHSRWGRRHPFMYGAILPVAVSYFFLWNPPADLQGQDLFIYFIIMAIIVRTAITFYEIPSSALVAELTDDYDQRTSFLSFRYFFGWWGGLAMAVAAYMVFLVPTDEIEYGVLNKDGYNAYGLVASGIMVVAILVSCLGTHKYIPFLRQPPEKQPFSLGRTMREMGETLANRSFAALFLSGFFVAMALGMTASLDVYLNTYFWEFKSDELGVMNMGYFASAAGALVIAPLIGRVWGKRNGAIIAFVLACVIAPIPYFLRYNGLLPANQTDELFYVIMFVRVVDVMMYICASILISSMIADVVEQSELKTGRRSEGLFFAARNFINKSVSGVGVVLATSLLTAIDFPTDAAPGEVEPTVVDSLAYAYAPLLFLLYLVAIAAIFFYRISRDLHQDNLRRLSEEAEATHM